MNAFLLSLPLAELCNFLAPRIGATAWGTRLVVQKFGSQLLKFFFGAMMDLRPISITLSNRKVYIGFVQTIPNLEPERAFVGILPILSGYRDAGTLELKPITDYVPALESAREKGKDPGQFTVLIPFGEIVTVNYFDVDVYRETFASPVEPRIAMP